MQPPGSTERPAVSVWLSTWNGVMISKWSLVSATRLFLSNKDTASDNHLVLAVWAGLALNGDVVPEAELDVYVQDALDELEFLTGSVDTKYGALRAKYGHPEPWTIRYVEVGNEDNLNNGLSSYKSYRFKAFYDAITEKYPDIQVLASTIDMTLEDKAGGDYHLYDIPDSFVTKFDMFDSYSPEHPILLGE